MSGSEEEDWVGQGCRNEEDGSYVAGCGALGLVGGVGAVVSLARSPLSNSLLPLSKGGRSIHEVVRVSPLPPIILCCE